MVSLYDIQYRVYSIQYTLYMVHYWWPFWNHGKNLPGTKSALLWWSSISSSPSPSPSSPSSSSTHRGSVGLFPNTRSRVGAVCNRMQCVCVAKFVCVIRIVCGIHCIHIYRGFKHRFYKHVCWKMCKYACLYTMQLWISLRIKCCKRLQECFDIMFCSVCMDNVSNRECPPSLVSLMWSDHQSHIICVFVFVYFLFVQMHTCQHGVSHVVRPPLSRYHWWSWWWWWWS